MSCTIRARHMTVALLIAFTLGLAIAVSVRLIGRVPRILDVRRRA